MEGMTELATVRGLAQFLGQDALFSRHVLSGRGGLRRDLRGYYILKSFRKKRGRQGRTSQGAEGSLLGGLVAARYRASGRLLALPLQIEPAGSNGDVSFTGDRLYT